SFFEGLDSSSLQTSSAQLFDERGEGLILKGGPGLKDKTDRQPYLSALDAFNLTRTALLSYKKEHGNYPARLVVHKTSRFHPEEGEGFQKAIEQSEIEIADFIWMPRRAPVRLFATASIRRCAGRRCVSTTSRPFSTPVEASTSSGPTPASTSPTRWCC